MECDKCGGAMDTMIGPANLAVAQCPSCVGAASELLTPEWIMLNTLFRRLVELEKRVKEMEPTQ